MGVVWCLGVAFHGADDMSPFYRCETCEVRWSWVDGRHCWVCGKLGQGSFAYSITATDEMIRDIDTALMPGPPQDAA